MKARNYQIKTIEMIRASLRKGNKKIAVQMVTGSGKTVVARKIIIKALKNKKKIFFILKGNKLMEQSMKKFSDLDFGVIWASKTRGISKNLIFMSQPTYSSKRIGWMRRLKEADIVFIDEAHDCTGNNYEKLLSDISPRTIVIGLSATFLRGASHKGHTYWQDFICPITGEELKEQGYLPDRDIYCPPIDYSLKDVQLTNMGDYNKKQLANAMEKSNTLFGDVISNYKQYNPLNLPTIAFCVNISHCEIVAKSFDAIGIKGFLIHSRLSEEKKDNFNKDLEYYINNKIPFVICSVDMLSRGIDIPELSVGLVIRPTKSRRLFFQQVGRLTRKVSDDTSIKEVVTILDFTPNTAMHGDPYSDIEPDKIDLKKKTGKKKGQRVRRCRECSAINPPHYIDCIVCGAIMVKTTEIINLGGTLRKVTFSEREDKVAKRLRQIMQFENNPKYRVDKNYRYRDIKRKFGEEHFYKSKFIPESIKKEMALQEVQKIIKKKT